MSEAVPPALRRSFREELDIIVHEPIERHRERIRRLGDHTIRELSLDEARRPASTEYNCFALAFDLTDSPAFRMIASRFGHLHADSAFAVYLIEQEYLRAITARAHVSEEIVIYFNGSQPTHAGRMYGDRIISKWGIGLLWEHGLTELPAQCGTAIHFYEAIERPAAEQAFLSYVAHRGVNLANWREWREFVSTRHGRT